MHMMSGPGPVSEDKVWTWVPEPVSQTRGARAPRTTTGSRMVLRPPTSNQTRKQGAAARHGDYGGGPQITTMPHRPSVQQLQADRANTVGTGLSSPSSAVFVNERHDDETGLRPVASNTLQVTTSGPFFLSNDVNDDTNLLSDFVEHFSPPAGTSSVQHRAGGLLQLGSSTVGTAEDGAPGTGNKRTHDVKIIQDETGLSQVPGGGDFNDFFWKTEWPSTLADKDAMVPQLRKFVLQEPVGDFTTNQPLAAITKADCTKTEQLRQVFDEELIETPRTIVDFTFFGAASRDALEVRMQELKDQVDLFVVAEANYDHHGSKVPNDLWETVLKKQKVFREFSSVTDRVLHLPVELTSSKADDESSSDLLSAQGTNWNFEFETTAQASKRLHSELQRRWFASDGHGQHLLANPTTESWALVVLVAHTDETPSRTSVQLVRHCKFKGESVDQHFPLHTASLMVQNVIKLAYKSYAPATGKHPYEISTPNFVLFHPEMPNGQGGEGGVDELDTFARQSELPDSRIIFGGAHMTGYPFLPSVFIKELQCTECDGTAHGIWQKLHVEIANTCATIHGKSNAASELEAIAKVISDENFKKTEGNWKGRFGEPQKLIQADSVYAEIFQLPEYFQANKHRFPAWFGKRQDPRATILCPSLTGTSQQSAAASSRTELDVGESESFAQAGTDAVDMTGPEQEPSSPYFSVKPARTESSGTTYMFHHCPSILDPRQGWGIVRTVKRCLEALLDAVKKNRMSKPKTIFIFEDDAVWLPNYRADGSYLRGQERPTSASVETKMLDTTSLKEAARAISDAWPKDTALVLLAAQQHVRAPPVPSVLALDSPRGLIGYKLAQIDWADGSYAWAIRFDDISSFVEEELGVELEKVGGSLYMDHDWFSWSKKSGRVVRVTCPLLAGHRKAFSLTHNNTQGALLSRDCPQELLMQPRRASSVESADDLDLSLHSEVVSGSDEDQQEHDAEQVLLDDVDEDKSKTSLAEPGRDEKMKVKNLHKNRGGRASSTETLRESTSSASSPRRIKSENLLVPFDKWASTSSSSAEPPHGNNPSGANPTDRDDDVLFMVVGFAESDANAPEDSKHKLETFLVSNDFGNGSGEKEK
ncbi:unnamed protein product [Amoebophrya sp. A120]|nr:unnamed protein product [Amoebophrya sp. A120]|eukprot:GSA120T00012343001.1